MSASSPAKAAGAPLVTSPKHRENIATVAAASQLIIRDVGEIQSRLLDHRPVILGETRYFIKEFEEKRGHRESRVLENMRNSISESSNQVLPKCTDTMQHQLELVLTTLETANQTICRVQKQEKEHAKSGVERYGKEKLRAPLEAFMKEQEQKRLAVDEEHRKAVQRLRKHYVEMDKELAKMASF